MKPIPLPYEMELVELKIKDKKLIKTMQGKEPGQVHINVISKYIFCSIHDSA